MKPGNLIHVFSAFPQIFCLLFSSQHHILIPTLRCSWKNTYVIHWHKMPPCVLLSTRELCEAFLPANKKLLAKDAVSSPDDTMNYFLTCLESGLHWSLKSFQSSSKTVHQRTVPAPLMKDQHHRNWSPWFWPSATVNVQFKQFSQHPHVGKTETRSCLTSNPTLPFSEYIALHTFWTQPPVASAAAQRAKYNCKSDPRSKWGFKNARNTQFMPSCEKTDLRDHDRIENLKQRIKRNPKSEKQSFSLMQINNN